MGVNINVRPTMIRKKGSDDLGEILSTLANRPVPTDDIIEALGVARSTYYLQREEGRLISADNLLHLARQFNINPVELMLHCGLITPDDVATTKKRVSRLPQIRLSPSQDLPPL